MVSEEELLQQEGESWAKQLTSRSGIKRNLDKASRNGETLSFLNCNACSIRRWSHEVDRLAAISAFGR